MGRRGGGRWGVAQDEAFLAALAVTGTLGEAAAAIGWSVGTALRRRRACAGFRARWAALATRPSEHAPDTILDFPTRDGGEARSRPKRVTKRTGWTPAVETEFLDHLASSCNVSFAAERAGISWCTAYKRRREHPAFERRWIAALEEGHARLEIELVRAAAESVEGVEFTERMVAPMSAETALRVLACHRNEVKRLGRRSGSAPMPPTLEEVKARIRRHAAAIRAARTSPPAPGVG